MKKKKNNIISFFLIFFIACCFGLFFFIQRSNDHKECQELETKLITEGKTTITREHICNEKYNF